MTEVASVDDLSPSGRFARDALVVTVCTLLSRLTGFARVLVAAACLGVGLLGDTYAAANTIPNIVFELVAGGALQAVLVPTFVAARRSGGDEELGHAASSVAAMLAVVLGMVVVVGVVLAPVISRVLVANESDPVVASDKSNLLTPMLIVFVPQVLFYGIGMVSTAALAARRLFMAAALAPAVNNVVVIICYLLYRRSLHGSPPSLHLSPWQFVLLAGGTTLAVVVFTAVPAVVLSAHGVRWRPRWSPRSNAVRALRGAFGWAMLSVGGTILPTAAAIVLGYDAPGGVAVFGMTFAFFVLPHALVAVPVATTLAPRTADAFQRGQVEAVRTLIERSMQFVVPLLLISGAAMVALAWPIGRIAASFGQAGALGVKPIAHALSVFGVGILGYGVAFTMTRVLFSLGDVRRASILVSVGAVVGVAAMALAAALFADQDRAAALALGYGVAQVVSAVLLTYRVHRLAGAPSWQASGRLFVVSLLSALGAGVAINAARALFYDSVAGAVAAIATAGVGGVVVFFGVLLAFGGVKPALLLGRGHRDV